MPLPSHVPKTDQVAGTTLGSGQPGDLRERMMGTFLKGMTFTMQGKEYEVLSADGDEANACIVYVLAAERETGDPLTMRASRAEACLARGDIQITGYDPASPGGPKSASPAVYDPLEQIAELKKRIQAIEQRRLTLLKADDPRGETLMQDNVIRPNKEFNIWDYTKTAGVSQDGKNIQYVKIRGLIIVLSSQNRLTEHFLFNISDQLQPSCRIAGDTISSDGRVKIDLSGRLQTIQGDRTQILSPELFRGHIELSIELGLKCQWASGLTTINAGIVQAAYTREINAAGFRMSSLAFPEIGNHMVAIEGVCVDVYTDRPRKA